MNKIKEKKIISKNIYVLPFSEKLNLIPEPAHWHNEQNWSKNALDFSMPKGTSILAAFDGTIFLTIDKYTKGGPDKSFLYLTNRIIISHEKGEYTDYVHLKKGLKVKKGDVVKKGQIIGYFGSTGRCTYPHLHFAVMVKLKSKWQTITHKFNIKGKIIKLQSPDLR